MDKKDCVQIGNIGENYVILSLSKIGISAIKLPHDFDFDIYTNNNLRIEVKTSRLQKIREKHFKNNKEYVYDSERYMFHNYYNSKIDGKKVQVNRDRECDFFILVCIDNNLSVLKSYIIPKNKVGNRRSIIIRESNSRCMWDNYLNSWATLL